MRKTLLLTSVQRQLGENDTARIAVFLTRTHRWALPFGFLAGVLCAAAGSLLGVFTELTSVIAVGIAGASMAALAATHYRVLVATTGSRDLMLFRGSKIRHVAVELLADDIKPASVAVTSSNAVTSHWQVGEKNYMVARRYQQAMTQLAANRSGTKDAAAST